MRDIARVRFLDAMEAEAPHVWSDLKRAALRADADESLRVVAEAWSKRWNLGAWVVDFAFDRVRRRREIARSWKRRRARRSAGATRDTVVPGMRACLREEGAWMPEGRPSTFQGDGEPALRYDPTSQSERFFRRCMDGYIKRVQAQAMAEGFAARSLPDSADLRRLVRWHVLRESVETIARTEVAASGRRSRGVLAEKSLANGLRVELKALATSLGLAERPAGRPGRRRLSAFPG